MTLRWQLHVGRIRTDEDRVLIHHNTGDFFAAEIDLASKYPWDIGHMTDEEEGCVLFGLSSDERTMFVDESREDNTTFALRGPRLDQWRFVTETGRYTWYITGYRRDLGVK